MDTELVSGDIIAIAGTFLVGFLVTNYAIPEIITFTKKHKLMDDPTLDKEQRKMHKDPIPTLGGVGIFIGFIVSAVVWLILSYFKLIPSLDFSLIISKENFPLIGSIAISLIILFVTGIFDDLTDLRASLKFLIQIGTAILVAYHGLRIDLFAIFNIEIQPIFNFSPEEISRIFEYAFSIFLIVGLTNAFNLIDGIDGLAGGLSFMNAMVLGVLLLNIGNDKDFGFIAFGFIAFGFAGALLGFLKYNFNPAKIFMGDTGSLIIGFLMAMLGIVLIKYSDGAKPNTGNSEMIQHTVIVVGILLLPVYDTLRVFAERIIILKTSPFKPDKNHVHHLLVKLEALEAAKRSKRMSAAKSKNWFQHFLTNLSNHKKAAFLLYLANAIIIMMAFLLKELNPIFAIPILFIMATLLSESINLTQLRLDGFKGKRAEINKGKRTRNNQLLDRPNFDIDLPDEQTNSIHGNQDLG